MPIPQGWHHYCLHLFRRDAGCRGCHASQAKVARSGTKAVCLSPRYTSRILAVTRLNDASISTPASPGIANCLPCLDRSMYHVSTQ